jgi:integrase
VLDSDLGYVIDMKLRMQLIAWDCYDANGYMFCTERGKRVHDLDKLFAQFLSDIGLQENELEQKRTLYSLRHTYCTRKLIQGVPPHILAKQTGHSVNILLHWYSKAAPVDWADILTSCG